MMQRLLKILAGLALLPFCVGFTWQAGTTFSSLAYAPRAAYLFTAGVLSYAVIHVLFRKPIFSYVVGHELTHALFAVLFGGSVKSFQASERGGRVTVTKSNFIITLAPYFFPIYTAFALVLHAGARMADAGPAVVQGLVFLCGATFAFHCTLTLIFLGTDQSDISEHGAFFSYPLIYLFNVVFAAFLVIYLIAADGDYLRFCIGGIMKSADLVMQLARKAWVMLFRA